MNYLSVCSGVEAATVAWHHMGWKPVGFSEIEKFPSEVLAHHYPTVTNFGDMTKYKEWKLDDPIGLLVGGTPCQSFSVAGLRKGLNDPRGNLALTYLGILDQFRPKWCVWENVPGVLSSGSGRDFGAFLGALGELGYGWAYRVLDAQNFGVAQRRRRVFVVGCFGDWRAAAEVLFESDCLRGDIKKGRKERQDPAAFTASSFANYSEGVGTIRAAGGDLGGGSETLYVPDTARCLTRGVSQKNDFETDTFVTRVYENHPADSRVKEMGDLCQTVTSRWGTGGGNVPLVQNVAYEWHNQDSRIKPIEVAATLNCNAGGKEGHLVQSLPIALAENTIGRQPQNGGNGDGFTEGGPMYTLNATGVHGVAFGWQNSASQGMSVDTISPTLDKSKTPAVALSQQPIPEYYAHQYCQDRVYSTEGITPAINCSQLHKFRFDMAVRRLTPVECERLQGFPDNYTNIKENCPDGPRYKAMGNSMAVPVMRWIGERINMVNNEQ
jgi:DNA (cytosine-5)-methyltransferase 1